MTALIKSIKDWSTLAHAEVLTYNAPLFSNDNSVGTVICRRGANVMGYEGQWLVLGSKLWIIKSIEPNEENIKVTVCDAYNAFYRTHKLPSGYTETGALLEALFNTNYKNQPDTEYAMPYLNITNTDNTPLIQPDLRDDLVFTMSDYIRLCNQRGVLVEIKPAVVGQGVGIGVDINIKARNATPNNLVFNDGHSQLISQNYNADITSKVTVINEGINHYWYLQANGTAAQIAPTPRIVGKWQTAVLKTNQTEQEVAESIFAKNTASIKLEFYSDKYFPYGSLVSFVGNGKVQTVEISHIAVNSEDYRYYYKAGDMAVTLVEKIKEVKEEAKATSTSGSSGGGTASGAVLYNTAQSLTDAQKAQARANIGAGTGGGGDLTGAVRYDTAQALTEAQKTQARANIGAGTGSGDLTGAVRYDVEQTLTGVEKTRARNNIGAGNYTKPVLGIPKTDLNSSVQSSLDKADSAAQIFAVTFTESGGHWTSTKTWDEIDAAVTQGKIISAKMSMPNAQFEMTYNGENQNLQHVFSATNGLELRVVLMTYSGTIYANAYNLAQISDIGSAYDIPATTSGITSSTVTCKKFTNTGMYTINVNGALSAELAAGTSLVIANIPAEHRPPTTFALSAFSSSGSVGVSARINSSGNVMIRTTGGAKPAGDHIYVTGWWMQ